jgi:hypothetical protein
MQQFRAVFEKSIRNMLENNERSRNQLEDFLGQLRSRTEQGGMAINAPFIPPSPPQQLADEAFPLGNPVTQDWVKTVIQAAILDANFLAEVGYRATQVVQKATQQTTPTEVEDTSPVPSTADSE